MTYEVYALKYAHHARRRSENFIGGDPHDGPMPLDYFVWLIRGAGREIVVDTGFSEAMAKKRGRDHLRCPTAALRILQCAAEKVKDVIVTHLHYDHVGNFDLFPAATLHLQDLEMRYATGLVFVPRTPDCSSELRIRTAPWTGHLRGRIRGKNYSGEFAIP